VLRAYIEHGMTPSRDSSGNAIVRLKMPSIHEAMVLSETHSECEVYQCLPDLDEQIELRWIVPESERE